MNVLEVNFEKKLKNFPLHIQFQAEGGCIGILGASGCGKSMTFKAIAGIETPDSGKICLGKRELFHRGHKVNLPPRKRSVGYLFQSYALFPNMTVFQNIEAGIQGKKAAKRERAMEMMEKFHLSELASGYPARLSGGQQQRVALARILAFRNRTAPFGGPILSADLPVEPELLLLDEPFSALDSYLKEELQFELKQHLREFGKTTIIVSHDRDEIYKLCDRTMVMGQGEILVSKDTKELFEQPERVIAARLTGCKNISRAKKCGMHKVYAMDWGVELTVDRKVSEKITHVGIRAHDFHPADASSHDSENKIPVAVDREVRAPFEWTILFRNRENPKENMWMKMEREQTQIPQWVQVDPKRILLLEE